MNTSDSQDRHSGTKSTNTPAQPGVSPEAAGFHPQRLQRLNAWMHAQIEGNRLAGASLLVSRHGRPAFFNAVGGAGRDSEGRGIRAFNEQTIVRLYSMTKPVTAVAAMMLHEQGHFQLDDPIARFLPAFSQMRVWTGQGTLDTEENLKANTVAAQSLITVRQLMTHTSGLTYGFMNATPVDQLYNDQGLVFPGSPESLESLVDRLALAPLLCQPGTQWNYSVASDVLGRLVEVWSGMSLAEYFHQAIFEPLAMHDTGFHVPADNADRFADLYGPAAGGDLGAISQSSNDALKIPEDNRMVDQPPVVLDTLGKTSFLQAPQLYSGGGGLVGTINDYARFCQMLLNCGELDGVRLLSRKTVDYMRANHLPGGGDMASMGQPVWSESKSVGIGFGLGFAVVLDPVASGFISSSGEYHWGGAASTFFWIDPQEDLFVVFLTQLFPSSTYPLRQELRTLVYQALET